MDLVIKLEGMALEATGAEWFAAQLEAMTYDLALAIIQWEDERGSTRESWMARARLREIEARLLSVQHESVFSDSAEIREDLQSARKTALDILGLLTREGIDVREVGPEQRRRLLHPVS
jgi:hypothetical protein